VRLSGSTSALASVPIDVIHEKGTVGEITRQGYLRLRLDSGYPLKRPVRGDAVMKIEDRELDALGGIAGLDRDPSWVSVDEQIEKLAAPRRPGRHGEVRVHPDPARNVAAIFSGNEHTPAPWRTTDGAHYREDQVADWITYGPPAAATG
jgi:hypothetical protein